jgi:hypothetical protein
MRRFKSARYAQRFLSIFGMISDLFSVGRHLLSAPNYRVALTGYHMTGICKWAIDQRQIQQLDRAPKRGHRFVPTSPALLGSTEIVLAA